MMYRKTRQTISLEAAKLLGVPFTWGAVFMRFVPSDTGPEVHVLQQALRYRDDTQEWSAKSSRFTARVEQRFAERLPHIGVERIPDDIYENP